MPWENVVEAFPFVFGWDDELRIICSGPALRHVARDITVGAPLDQVFEVQSPEGSLSSEWLEGHRGVLLLLRHRASGMLMRGQVMRLTGASVDVFLGTPWLNAADDLDRLGLTLADFAPHDSTQDLLHVVQVHRITNDELRTLNERLKAKQAQLIEKEAEARKLAKVAESTNNAVILADRAGKIEWVNKAFERMTGWQLDAVHGKKPGAFLQGPRTDPAVARDMGTKLDAGEGFHTEILNYRKDGSPYWVDIEVQPITDHDGHPTHFMAIEAEVSEKKRQEVRRQLETAAAKVIANSLTRDQVIPTMLQTITTQLQWVLGAWWVPDETGGRLLLAAEWHAAQPNLTAFLKASQAIRFNLGEGLPGRVWADRTSHWITDVRRDANFPRRDAAGQCGITAALAFPVHVDGDLRGVVEFFSLHLDPPDPDLLESLNHIGSQLGLMLKRVEAEEALQESERAMNEGQRLAHLGTWEWNLRTNALAWSDEKFRIYGFEPRSFVPTLEHVRRCVLPEDLPHFLDVLTTVAKSGNSAEVSYRVTRPNGDIRHVHTRAAAECDAEGVPFRVVGTMHDFTEALETENAYKQAQRISHLGNWSLNVATGEVQWSDEKYRIYGYEPGSVRVDLDFCKHAIHPDDVDSVMKFINEVISSGQQVTTLYRIIRPDGELRHLRSSAEARRDASGKVRDLLGTVLDITDLVEAQRTLQETEERWQFALENNGLGVWDWNVVSGFVLYTDRLQQMLGYEPGEWPQHVDSWASRVHPDDLPAVMEAMNKCLGRETPDYICEHRLRCKDGSWKWVQDVGRIVSYTKDGKPLRMIGTQMDIHIRKRSEEAARRRAELLNRIRSAQEHFIGSTEAAPVFTEMLDVIVEHTRSSFGFIGEVLKDDEGNPFLRSYSLTDITWNEQTRQVMAGMGTKGLEFRNLKTLFGVPMVTGEVLITNDAANDPRSGGLPPGHPPIHTFLGLPVYNGLEMVGLVGLANKPDGYDQEGLKELDPFLAAISSMIVARRESERRSKIEEELRAARDKAEAASRAKSEFLAVISHEIRTPMNGVLGMAGLLKESPLDKRQAEMVEAVLHSGKALVHIIDDMLDFAKIEASQIELREQPVKLDELVEGVADLLHQEAASKGLELTTILSPELPDVILGDPGRLRQVLLNLVGNAVKFTDKGHVTIRVEETQGGIEFRVTDTGIGVRSAAHDRLFKPFSQVDSSPSRRFGGTGLGLAICKRLVDVMGGEIGVSSKPGKGSQFWFRVPLLSKTAAKSASPRGGARARRVWIAHESPRLRASIRSSLTAPHVEIRELKRSELAHVLPDLAGECDTLIISAAWLSPLSATQLGMPAKRVIVINSSLEDERPKVQDFQFLTLPLHRQVLRNAAWSDPKPKRRPGTAGHQPKLGLRVLVAEDNRVNARLACLLLENLGCLPIVAINGKDAVAKFQQQHFDAILMDCQMPVMDGHAATRKIRRLEHAKSKAGTRCKIIAMTASALPEERERCIASGMDEHLSKPFASEALAAMLANISHQPCKEPTKKIKRSQGTIDSHFNQLVSQIGHDEAAQLARFWLEESEARSSLITKSISSGDVETARKAAHALRGSASIFGMEDLANTCESMESAVKKGQKITEGVESSLAYQLHEASKVLRLVLSEH